MLKRTIAGLGAAGVLASTVLLTSGSTSIAAPDGTLRVVAVTTEEGGSGETVGSTFAFGGDLYAVRRGDDHRAMVASGGGSRDPIGRFGVSCVITSVEEAEANCTATASIDRRRGDEGQITVQALLEGDEDSVEVASGRRDRDRGDEWAITGGTDDFENAGGTLTTRDISGDATLLTFEFAD